MRTPFRLTGPSQTTLPVLYACCVLWGAPGALTAAEQIKPPPSTTTSPPAATVADNSTFRIGNVLLDGRLLALLAMGGAIGILIGSLRRDPHEPRVRLLHKPKRTRLSVLVPPGPAPRLIPSDSPNVTRPRSTRAPVRRQIPVGAARPRVIDYLAAFADPAQGNAGERIDYVLIANDDEQAPDGFEDSSHQAG